MRRRRSSTRAANGSTQITYQGSNHAVATISATVAQAAAARQSPPWAVRQMPGGEHGDEAGDEHVPPPGGQVAHRRQAEQAGELVRARRASPPSAARPGSSSANANACPPNPIAASRAMSARPVTAIVSARSALVSALGRQQQEREHEAGGQLDPDRHHERGDRAPVVGHGGAEQDGREQRGEQRVVVKAADRVDEQDRVEPDERRRPRRRASDQRRGAGDDRHHGQARRDGDRLQRPQAAAHPERRERIAGDRVHGPVRGVDGAPAEEAVDRIERHGRRGVVVGIEAVQRTEAGEAEIAEHVLGEERRPEQQDQLRADDRCGDRAQRCAVAGGEHEAVAGTDEQQEVLEAVVAQSSEAEAVQRAREPCRESRRARWPARTRSAHRRRRRSSRATPTMTAASPVHASARRAPGDGPRPARPGGAPVDPGATGAGGRGTGVVTCMRLLCTGAALPTTAGPAGPRSVAGSHGRARNRTAGPLAC